MCQPRTYVMEKFILTDSKGHTCQIRAAFDEHNFILRSCSIVEMKENLRGDMAPLLRPIKKIRTVTTESCTFKVHLKDGKDGNAGA